MKARSMRVRTKVVALLVSLVALWAFAAFVTLREGLNLLWVAALDKGVAQPNESLLLAMEQERRLSMVVLGSGGRQQREALTAQRARTNAARARFQELTSARDVRLAASDAAEQRIDQTIDLLGGLERTRAAIDNATVDRARVAAFFTDVISAGYRIYDSLATLDEPGVAKDVRTLIKASRARELLSQEDALLAGVLATGRFADREHGDFVRLVGAQRFLYAEAAAELPPADKVRYGEFVNGAVFTRFRTLEDRVIDKGQAGAAAPVGADEWRTAVEPVFAELLRLEQLGGDDVVSRATPAAAWVVVRLILAGGLGLIAVIASIIVSITTARSLIRQLERLRNAALDVFLNLARRTQALVHRQLRLLDAMERRETNAEELDDLFRVDHLATRMRRNAENLIVLSGAVPGRGWRNAVPMVDVVRGAVAEVEDYTRVTVLPVRSASLAGRAVGDVIHLLAELIENAVSFSPPYTVVQVSGHLVANGFAVEVEDRGLGMSEADLEAANEQLRNPPDFTLSSTARLGLYVISRLAERHGIRVRLRESPYGGTTAIVLIPQALVVHAEDSPALGDSRTDQRAAISAGTRAAGAGVVDGDVVTGSASDAPPAPPSPPSPRHAAEPVTAAAPAPAEPAVTAPAQPAPVQPVPAPPAQPAQPAQPAPAQPEPVSAGLASEPATTPFGLPRRVRQTNLAAPLRDAPAEEPADSSMARRPEQVREMMASYQQAINRGRLDASRPPDGVSTQPEVPPAEPVQPEPGSE